MKKREREDEIKNCNKKMKKMFKTVPLQEKTRALSLSLF